MRVEQLDVADADSVTPFAKALGDQPVDLLVNNAGVGVERTPLEELDPEGLIPLFRVNAVGPLREILACDFFTTPTVTFKTVTGFVVMEPGRRRILACDVPTHPTAEWATSFVTVTGSTRRPSPLQCALSGYASSSRPITRLG